MAKRYLKPEKDLIIFAETIVLNRYDMENRVAPLVAQLLGRTTCAICKQIENVKGIHYRQKF